LIDQSVSTAQYDSEDAFSLIDDDEDIIFESAFGAQVTFIDDNNNVLNLGDNTDDEGIVIGQEVDPRESNGFIGSECHDSPEEIDSFEPYYLTWCINIANVFVSKTELVPSELKYGDTWDDLDSPLVVLSELTPFSTEGMHYTSIVKPGTHRAAGKRTRQMFKAGLLPALTSAFGTVPAMYPVCYRRWHQFVYDWLRFCLMHDDHHYNRPVIINCDKETIFLCFFPDRAATPSISVSENNVRIHSRDMQQDSELSHTLFFDYDSLECWKDPEEFWASVDEGYGAVPIPYAWQPYYSDLDPQLTHITLSEVTQPEPSEEGMVTVDVSLSRASLLVSEVSSADTQNVFYRRQYKDTNPPSYFEVRRAATAIEVQLVEFEVIDNTEYVTSCSDSETESMEDLEEFDWIACTNNALQTSSQPGFSYAVTVHDPSLEDIENPANLNNYLPDSGATQHMAPCQEDLYDAVEGQNLGVEVADAHIIHCSTTGKVKISMLDDHGDPLVAELHGCMYVPGLSRRLFSITRFATNGHHAPITKDNVTLYFGPQACPVTIPLCNRLNIANNARIVRRPLLPWGNTSQEHRLIPDCSVSRRGQNHVKYVNLSLLHDRLGHRAMRTLLSADEHNVWHDTKIRIEPETDCVSCQIAMIRTTNRNKLPHTPQSSRCHRIYGHFTLQKLSWLNTKAITCILFIIGRCLIALFYYIWPSK